MKSYEEIAETVFRRRGEYEKKQKERAKMIRKISVLAACICFVIAIGFVIRYTDIIRDTSIAEPDPTVQTGEVTPTEPPATEPSGIGGYSNVFIDCEYEFEYYSVSSKLIDYVGDDEFEEWRADVNANGSGINIYDFVTYFEIPKEVFLEKGGGEEQGYSSEEVDALYSGDPIQVMLQFMNEDALFLDGKIYPPKWFADHTMEEILELGLSVEDFEDLIIRWENSDYIGDDNYVISASKSKLSEYKTMMEEEA